MKTNDLTPARKGRTDRTFVSMAATYSMGVFNDNFFKQAAMMIALGAGLTHIQGSATVYFALPFILFSAWAGWLADRFPKKNVVVNGKLLELLAMIIGAAGIITTNWLCILSMVFLMGLQSAIFGPALNGSIPEHFQEKEVMKINGTLKMITTLAILIGIACAGFVLDFQGNATGILAAGTSQILIALIVVAVALAGVFTSLSIDKHQAADPDKPFPWSGPWSSIKDFWSLRRDPQLFVALISNGFFYFLATLVILIINSLGIIQLGFSPAVTSLLTVALMVGVACGSLFSAKSIQLSVWAKVLLPGSAGMGVGLLATALFSCLPVAITPFLLFITLGFTGFCGGMFLIPINSFIQMRPDKKNKGRVIATGGFCSFIGILLAGQTYYLMDRFMDPSSMMVAAGTMSILMSIAYARFCSLDLHPGDALFSWAVKGIVGLRYRVEVKGLESIAPRQNDSGILFLPNHPALIDPVILTGILHKSFRPRPLADYQQTDRFYLRPLMKMINAIRIPNTDKFNRTYRKHISSAISKVASSLRQGDNILFYPAGRLYRSKDEQLGANSGVKTILEHNPRQRVVLVRTSGLWGSSFSWETGETPSPFKKWQTALRFLLANGLFFGPRRKVKVEFVEPVDFPRDSDRLTINRTLERFYNENASPKTIVPLFWWQGGKEIQQPESSRQNKNRDWEHIPQSIKDGVLGHISKISGIPQIAVNDRLAQDIGLDSLAIMDLAAWLEQEFGLQLSNIESLHTAGDCILAACRQLGGSLKEAVVKVPGKWFDDPSTGILTLPEKGSVALVMLHTAGLNPDRAIVADRVSGVKTYRQFIMAVMLLSKQFGAVRNSNLGIMLPATVGAAISYFSVMFSGKTPVMLNWTIGENHLRHCLKTTGTTHIVTARTLIEKLEDQGMDFSNLPVRWIYLEDLRNKLPLPAKLAALIKSYLPWRSLYKARISKTAAILFTSGSEAMPKAVPLSHANILANIRDFSSVLEFEAKDRLLGMLPPFHSLGLAGNIIMPLCLGLKTTYHANPTEGGIIAGLIENYRSTLLIGTPTFLKGIIGSSTPDQLSTLRLIFTGAEKCPDYVYRQVKELLPRAVLCEGYGITECSPVVTINNPDNPQPGTIGRILSNMEYLIVHPDRKTPVETGKQGLLLVKGENVFAGYLDRDKESPFITVNGKEWYNTGDLVSDGPDSILTFRGRLKRFIKLGGEMISLPAIEEALQQHFPGKDDGTPAMAVESTPNEDHPELVLFATFPAERREINQWIRQAGLSALHNIRQLIHLEEIPVLGTGKTDYRKLKAALL